MRVGDRHERSHARPKPIPRWPRRNVALTSRGLNARDGPAGPQRAASIRPRCTMPRRDARRARCTMHRRGKGPAGTPPGRPPSSISPRSVRGPTRRRIDLPCVQRAGPSPLADGIGGHSQLRRPGDPERPAVDRRSDVALGGIPPIRYPPPAGTTWRRRRRLRPPSQVAPSADLLRAVIVTWPDETPELVHSPRGLARPSPVDRAPQALFEFEPPADRLAEDLRPVDVPELGHPLLGGGVDLDAHDLHGTRILLVILKDYLARIHTCTGRSADFHPSERRQSAQERSYANCPIRTAPWRPEVTSGPTSASWSRAAIARGS